MSVASIVASWGRRPDTRGAGVLLWTRRTLAVTAALLSFAAPAQDSPSANTLIDLRRTLGACLQRTPIATGSRVTIMFMMRRDGSVFGRPRISYAHLEGDADTKRRFLDEAERAVDACLPAKVTPALGAAIAGRMFAITLGRERPGV
ncbi:MAG TPA: hypothetical protein VEH77_16130 [Roseiarcus sp.]|nr:hypothetical protein [Roseiarcus sp.]